MSDEAATNNGHLTLERGGAWGSWAARRGVKRRRLLVPSALGRKLDCRMHFAALKVRGAAHETPSRQWQAIKETTHRPWSILARRLVEAKEAGVPQEQVEAMALALREWIEKDLYGQHDDDKQPPRAA